MGEITGLIRDFYGLSEGTMLAPLAIKEETTIVHTGDRGEW